jgi:hypothetical protein
MTLPAGVLTANLTFGRVTDDAGEPPPRKGRVTILASVDRVWEETGDLALATNITIDLEPGAVQTLPLTATDQPGFVNRAGLPVTSWTYDAVVDYYGRPRQLITFALPTGGVDGLVVDFDRLIPVEQSDGQTVAVTMVTSVDGEPGAVNTDAATAARVTDTGTATGAALAAAFAPVEPPLVAFARKLASGGAVVAVAGDSASDETAEWWCRTWDAWAALHPEVTLTYKAWDDTTSAYITTTRQTGTSQIATALPVSDTFTRTAADLRTTDPSRPNANGSAWTGAVGAFSIDGSSAVWTASTGFVGLYGGTGAGMKRKAAGSITVNTTAAAANKTINVGLYTTGTNIERISLFIRVTSGGVISWGVEGQFPTFATIVTGGGSPLAASSTQTVDWELTVDGASITAKLNGVTAAATLTAPQQASADAMTSAYILPAGTLTGTKINDFRIEVDMTAVPPRPVTVINASRAGSTLAYQQARASAMFGGEVIDALYVSSSHNYGSTSAADYQTAVAHFLGDYQALQPSSAIVLVAQNPEVVPASNRTAHRLRMLSLGPFAAANGYGFLDALAAFESTTGYAATLLRTDGVHPTAASVYDGQTDPGNGQYVWMQASLALLGALGA